MLACAALARDGVPIPASRLEANPDHAHRSEHRLAAECLAHSKLIATLNGIDPGLLDRRDWAWVESVVRPATATSLADSGDVAGFAERVLAALA